MTHRSFNTCLGFTGEPGGRRWICELGPLTIDLLRRGAEPGAGAGWYLFGDLAPDGIHAGTDIGEAARYTEQRLGEYLTRLTDYAEQT